MLVRLQDLVADPKNVRETFRDIDKLADSIEVSGLLQNLVVRSHEEEGKYFIVCGERRFRALQRLQKRQSMIPVGDGKLLVADDFPVESLCIDGKSRVAISIANLAENTARDRVPPWDLGAAYNELQEEHGMSQLDIAESTGRTQPHVSQCITIATKLHPDVLKKLAILQDEAPSSVDLLAICKAVNELAQPDSEKQLSLLTQHYTRATAKKSKKPGLIKQFSTLRKMSVTPAAKPIVDSVVAFLKGDDRYFKYEESQDG